MNRELPGNDDLRRRLADLVARDRLHPCMLFEGPQGVGKAQTALWLARLANCEVAPQPLDLAADPPPAVPAPCGRCWSCRQIPKGGHPDVIRVGLDPERTAPIISVRQARELVGALTLRPYHARRRFVIIDPADAMNVEAANALLKTFEEPPEATGFVLVTSAAWQLLPTVRSRSQRVRFGTMATGDLTRWLESRGVADAAAIARLADGCPGRAWLLADTEAKAWLQCRDAFLEAVGGPMAAVFAYGAKLVKGERAAWTPRVERLLDAVMLLGRDALVVFAFGGAAGVELLNADRTDVVEAWARALGPVGVAAIARAVERARGDMDAYVNPRLLVDTFVSTVAAELGSARTVGATARES